MYTITITKTTIEEKPAGQEWEITGKKREGGGDTYAYTPEIVKKKEVELKVYEQIVDELDLKAVIAAVNAPDIGVGMLIPNQETKK